jgi:glycosyltransferase involved in cell wall biosynthesis
MKYLFVDLNISLDGHKLGFMQNTLNYLAAKNDSNSYAFLANKSADFKIKIPEESKNIEVFYSNDEQNELVKKQKRTLQKAKVQWDIISLIAKENLVDHVIMMDLDLYQISIGLSKTPFSISGIWFRPYLRLQPDNDSLKAKIRCEILKIQKKITVKIALRNKNLKKIFILNDETMPQELRSVSGRFQYLSDPIFPYSQIEGFDLRKQYAIKEDKLILLQFGFIDERKNNENIIKAIQLLADDVASKICLLIIGKFEKDYALKIQKWKGNNAKFQLIMRDEFVSDAEMESTFAQSDIILRMNHTFAGSSGIVGIAASHDKPCIVSDFGVMADQVEKYKLGLIINPNNSKAISDGIMSFYTDKSKLKIDGSAYRNTHDVAAFVETLLKF